MLLQISCDYQGPLQDSINNVWLWGCGTHTRLCKPPKQFSTLPPRLHQPKDCKRACDNTNSLGLAKAPSTRTHLAQHSRHPIPCLHSETFHFPGLFFHTLRNKKRSCFPPYPCTSHAPLHLFRTESTWVLWPSIDSRMGNHMLHLSSLFSLVPGASPLP